MKSIRSAVALGVAVEERGESHANLRESEVLSYCPPLQEGGRVRCRSPCAVRARKHERKIFSLQREIAAEKEDNRLHKPLNCEG